MKQILILGGGFAGVKTALNLEKKLKHDKDVSITVVDDEPYHLFHANLYEIATSPEELTSIAQLKRSVVLPFKDIFANKKINFVQGIIENVDLQRQSVSLGSRSLNYDYLVLALGATNNFYNIPGAEENSLTLYSVKGALRIRNRLEFLAQMHRTDVSKKQIRIAIAGGGFAGVEIAAELKGYLDYLAWENNIPREKFETLIIEGGNRVLPGLEMQISMDVGGRLRSLGVRIQTDSFIAKVDEHFLEFKNGEKISYDCLIWTAGVKSNSVPMSPQVNEDRSGRIAVNEHLQMPAYPNVFVAGDKACIMDKDGRPLPGTAMQAMDQANFLGEAISKTIENQKPEAYQTKKTPFFIPLGGKWMIFKFGPIYITGLLSYLIRQAAFFRYFMSILGPVKAARLLYLENKLYVRND